MESAEKAELYIRVEGDVLTRTIEEKQYGAGAQGQATSQGWEEEGLHPRGHSVVLWSMRCRRSTQPSCCSGPHASGCSSSSTRVLRAAWC